MNVSATYTKAVNTLKPNTARMAAIHEAGRNLNTVAKAEVAKLIDASGMTGGELYKISCANKNENETALNKEIRIVLLGLARKGK